MSDTGSLEGVSLNEAVEGIEAQQSVRSVGVHGGKIVEVQLQGCIGDLPPGITKARDLGDALCVLAEKVRGQLIAIILNCREDPDKITFQSSFLGQLLRLRKIANEMGIALHLAGVSDVIEEKMGVTRLNTIISTTKGAAEEIIRKLLNPQEEN